MGVLWVEGKKIGARYVGRVKMHVDTLGLHALLRSSAHWPMPPSTQRVAPVESIQTRTISMEWESMGRDVAF